MKKINKLTLENFKFFNGEEEFNFEGKNVLIYGENGSGKSSIYWALYTFFQSSLKNNDEIKKYFTTTHTENLTNRFIKEDETSSIKLELIDEDENIDEPMIISETIFDTNKDENTQIQEAMKASDFINFKLLSRLYDFKNPEQIDLFIMFEKEVLNYLFIDDLNLSSLWNELKIGLDPKPKMSDQSYKDFQEKITLFNNYFMSLIPILLRDTNNFLKNDFNENMEISINYQKATYNDFLPNSTTKRDSKTTAPNIKLEVKLLNEDIENDIVEKPHTFLNEAKLTAISLSLRFSILKNRLVSDLKVLVLDDLLISLDMSYRIEVINILEKHFSDFQLIIMTHDKGFYQLLKRKISTQYWNVYELYNQNDKQCVKEAKSSFEKAKKLLEEKDYEATAHFLRKETEEILKHYLDPDLKYINKEFVNLEALINRVKKEIEIDYIKSFDKFFRTRDIDIETAKKIRNFEDDTAMDGEVKRQLFQARGDLFNLFIKYTEYKDSEVKIFEELKNIKDRVLNPSSHYSEAPIFRQEIHDAIDLIDRLKNFLNNKNSTNTISQQSENCIETTESAENIIPENTDVFMIDFTEDILDKIIEIDESEKLNEFLKENILNNLNSFTIEQFNEIVNKITINNRANYFNDESGEILKNIFQTKEWDLEHKKTWCRLINSININDTIKEWFENRNCYNTNPDFYNDESPCDFLDLQTVVPEIDSDEIPF
ncbi:MAG: ATP-binding protein [Campylobacterota bacterium]|nr:ATP-binding protein [Campylobacterota bacterium]